MQKFRLMLMTREHMPCHSASSSSSSNRLVASMPPPIRIRALSPKRAIHAHGLVVLRVEFVVMESKSAFGAAKTAGVEEVSGRGWHFGVAGGDPQVHLPVLGIDVDVALAVEAGRLGGARHHGGAVDLLLEVRERRLGLELVGCLCGEVVGLGLAEPLFGVSGAAGAAGGVLLMEEEDRRRAEESG